jgi:hypothetical protein
MRGEEKSAAMNLQAVEIKAFVPARDFAAQRIAQGIKTAS